MNKKEVSLESLVGPHVLWGVSFSSVPIEDGENANTMEFVLDGVKYTAMEDPSDGYRSSLASLIVSKMTKKKSFDCAVLVVMRQGNDPVLDFYDAENGKLVLSVGTTNYDDYYPCYCAEFTPENMRINENISTE